MTFRNGWQRLLRVGKPSAARDVDHEIAFHFEQKIQDFIAQGMSASDARARAEEEFGDVDSVRNALRTIDERVALKKRRAEWWEAGAQDLGYVIRTLRRSPGFTVAVVLTLALGLGANAALFSLLDRLYLRAPVGVLQPENLRRVYVYSTRTESRTRPYFAYPVVNALRQVLPVNLLIAGARPEKLRIGRDFDTPLRRAAYVVDDYFGVMGARLALGRFFSPDERRPDGLTPVAVLSYSLWRAQFGGDSSIIGRVIELGSRRYTVIGVAGDGFRGTDLDAIDMWLPFNTMESWTDRKAGWYNDLNVNGLQILTRVPPGVPTKPFEIRMTLVMRDSSLSYYAGSEAFLGSIHEARAGVDTKKESAISARLGGVALVILLIACANVVNLLLARAMKRRREIALRLALGVSRRRLIMQLITESGVLAVLAGSVSLVVAYVCATLLRKLLLPGIQWDAPAVGGRVVLFTMILSVTVGIIAGLVPALQSSGPDVTRALRGSVREGAYHRSRLRTGLLIAQAAMSVVLLAGAGVFIRSLRNVEGIDIGYVSDQLVFANVSYDAEVADHAAELAQRVPELAQRVRSLPGVEAVALIFLAPMSGFAMASLKLPDRDSLPPSGGVDRFVSYVSPEYFSTVGIHVLKGRDFTNDDRAGAPSVMAMNEAMARNLWPGEDPLTKCIIVGTKNPSCRQVVAIVSAAHASSILEKPAMQYYVPWAQSGRTNAPRMAIRTQIHRTSDVSAQVRKLIVNELGAWSRPSMQIMRDYLEPQMRPWRMGAALFTAAGVLALIVAAIGVHSSLAYTISQRSHEMGVRVALGARGADIGRLVVGEGVRVVLVGVGIGIVIAIALGRFVESLLYDTSPRDPLVLVVVAFTLLGVALLACAVPAWRASRTDPMDALRAG